MLKFLLVVSARENLCGSYYFQHVDKTERKALESDVTKKCLSVKDSQCSFLNYKEYKIIYRCFNTLLFIVGTDEEENELAVYEFIQLFVEALDRYFNTVNEQHLHVHQDKVRMILHQIIVNGYIVETNLSRILEPLQMIDSYGGIRK